MLLEKGTTMQLNTSRCLNQHHKGVECDHCVKQCPGQALTVHDKRVYHEKERCLGCGLCLNVCPTEVFTSTQWDETTIVEKVMEKEVECVQVFCGKHERPFLTKDTEKKLAIQVPACLSSISAGAWYELGSKAMVELRLDACKGCLMENGIAQRMNVGVETAMEWLLASGHVPEFSYILFQTEKTKPKKKLKALPTGVKVTSRRELFLSAINLNKLGQAITQNRVGRPSAQKKQSLLPKWRQRFEQSFLSQAQGDQPAAAYWPSISINDDCVNCGMCGANCPTHALKITMEDGNCLHTFTSGNCIDCRICMLFCTAGSITRSRSVDQQPFQAKTVHHAPAALCKRCGSTTFINEDNLCHWCKEEPPVFDILSDVRKNILKEMHV